MQTTTADKQALLEGPGAFHPQRLNMGAAILMMACQLNVQCSGQAHAKGHFCSAVPEPNLHGGLRTQPAKLLLTGQVPHLNQDER